MSFYAVPSTPLRRTLAAVLAFVLAFLMCTADVVIVHTPRAYAVTSVSGVISQDTTWTASAGPYRVTSDVTVSATATLTIEAGTVVKFDSGSDDLIVSGRLVADAEPENPIYFTSWRDDQAGGDTNGDGGASSPAASDWSCIRLDASSSGSVLDNVVVRYAGYDTANNYAALRVYTTSASVTDCAFTDNALYPIAVSTSGDAYFSGNEAARNGWNGMRIGADATNSWYAISGNPTWEPDLPILVYGQHDISSECTVTIEPGAAVKFLGSSSGLDVYGALVADGTAEDPIYFTSRRDDSVGGDTNNDGSATSPAKSDWQAIWFHSGSAGVLNHAVVRYGGYDPYNNWSPLCINSDDVQVTNSEFSDNDSYAIAVHPGRSPVLRGNEAHDNDFNGIVRFIGNAYGGSVSGNALWTRDDIPYVIGSVTSVSSGATLTIEPGTVVKFKPGLGLTVSGTLLAEGDSDARIVFTSRNDDSVGGDTNGDGAATSPAAGDWKYMRFNAGSDGSRLTDCEIVYGGDASYPYACIYVNGSSPVLDYVNLTHISGYGIVVSPGAPRITHSTISQCSTAGVRILSFTGAGPVINWNDIYSNGAGGTTNLSAPVGSGIDARYNYWGRTSGPRAVEHTYAQCEPWLWYSFKTPASAQVLGGRTWCGIWGEPVNTATGNFYYEASDLVLPGVGPSIAVGRTYNHQDAASRTVLGYGWTLDCDSFVQPQSDGSALVVYSGGARKTFAPNGTGGYVAPQGTLDTLAPTATGGFTLTSPERTVNTYGTSGTLLTVADRYGNMVVYTRNALGAITRIEGTGGRYVVFTYTGDLLTTVADNAGRQVIYAYTTSGDLRTVTDVTGAVTTYTSDTSHRVTSVASAEHPTEPFVSHTYDAANRVDVQHDGYGNTGTLSYAEGATTITNNRGFTELHEFDSEYRLTAATDGAGDVTSRTYNAAGLVESVTDGNDHTTSFTYDGNGNQTGATDAAGHATSASYDLANNNLLWSEDAEDIRTTYSYDATGTYLERVTNPVYEIVYGHYTNGLVSDVTLAGATTHFVYDAAGRLTSVTDSLGATSTVAYDTAGNVTGTTDAMGRSASFTYDAAGRVLTATDPADETVTFAYDANGNRTSATDQLGKVTHFTYDVLDKLAGVTDPLANSWAYTYDENYNLSSVTNPRGATTSYTYSADDLLTAIEDALGHTWAFSHDAVGNTLESEYPTGETVSRTYTSDGLLATSEYSTDESYTFAYTPAHRLSSVTDSAGRAQAFAYNPVGWLTSAEDTADGTAFATSYAYDDAGRVTSLDSDAAPEVAYAFDLAGRLTSLEASGAVATFTHDAAGARTGVTLPNGAITSFGYDAAGRIESIVTTAASGVIAESYARDAAGRVTSDSSGTYAYDDAGRLVTWTARDDTVTTYTYDDAYNLTGASVDGSATASFTYDAADRITSAGFTFDDAGNLTSDGLRLFTYDAACRLVAVADASTETTIATYTYDAMNRRISATEGTATVFFHYDGASARVIAETDGSGETLASYAYDSEGALFSMTRGGATYYYHTNARGDVVAMTDASGAVVNTYSYDPWGTLLASSETVSNPYRYASYRYDEATGLAYCWNRYYAPELARFLTRDIYPGELSDPVTMNSYLYCGGDPVNRVDPSGMWTWALPIIGSVNVTWQNPAVSITTNQLTFDDDGNVGIMQSGGIGLGTGWGGSLGYAVQRTNADTIYQLEGPGFVAGASGTALVGSVPVNGGAEYCSNWKHEYSGFNAFLGIGFGNTAGVLPVEGHGEVTYSTIPISFNVHDVWAKLTGR